MRDFTVTIYCILLNELKNAKYEFVSFEEYLAKSETNKKTIILRHDVDRKPERSVKTAKIENETGIRGTYYFRVKKNNLPKEEIKTIAELGHEIGYHYEDLDTADGDVKNALESFKRNLECLREIAPIKTICMHGSPMSRFDNREMWKDRDYRNIGILGEPYFDIDFSEVLYLTDTGRRWDGERVSIRDQVISIQRFAKNRKNNGARNRSKLHSTKDILDALKNNRLPDKIMLTVHPQRWMNEGLPWMEELVWQSCKNFVKYFFFKKYR